VKSAGVELGMKPDSLSWDSVMGGWQPISRQRSCKQVGHERHDWLAVIGWILIKDNYQRVLDQLKACI
jgi:hypothetical protein